MKLFREPLLHFAVGGAILFGGYTWLNSGQPVASDLQPVRIGEGELGWLSEIWSKQWLRQPSSQELQGLVADLVTEELFAREAQEIGLGENDTIIRRRLAQKLRFLVEDTTRLVEPSEAQLRAYYDANTADYQTLARLSFTHVYFSLERHRDAKFALAELRVAGNHHAAKTVGDRFLLDTEFRDVDEQSVAGTFGPEFSKAVFGLEAGVWSGPIKSGYGDHLVFIETSTPASQRPFEEVREKVLEEWRAEQQRSAVRDYIARLREKYGVVFDDRAKASLGGDPARGLAVR
ncbi:peptidyl-prolyl cis-trans isomerase [Rhizobium gallicum]|uniref:peptidylprolyl isomerase n=1 Tax=Rhizobium gallicum TaxID=56730 RepID=UPI001EF822BF|nr:peptidylprolyl isomerase [Rhizobium gallicum]ULJ76061.1 peptidyl-prolyl cis-trans isomerase [Rhizobium gallicum]